MVWGSSGSNHTFQVGEGRAEAAGTVSGSVRVKKELSVSMQKRRSKEEQCARQGLLPADPQPLAPAPVTVAAVAAALPAAVSPACLPATPGSPNCAAASSDTCTQSMDSECGHGMQGTPTHRAAEASTHEGGPLLAGHVGWAPPHSLDALVQLILILVLHDGCYQLGVLFQHLQSPGDRTGQRSSRATAGSAAAAAAAVGAEALGGVPRAPTSQRGRQATPAVSPWSSASALAAQRLQRVAPTWPIAAGREM